MSINDAFESENVRRARRVSEISVAWTVCASTLAVVVGVNHERVVDARVAQHDDGLAVRLHPGVVGGLEVAPFIGDVDELLG